VNDDFINFNPEVEVFPVFGVNWFIGGKCSFTTFASYSPPINKKAADNQRLIIISVVRLGTEPILLEYVKLYDY
jgi:hypothetical protein